MKPTYLAALVLAQLLPGTAGSAISACEIRLVEAGSSFLLEVHVAGDPGAVGQYRLTLNVASGSNQSSSIQGGQFAIPQGRDDVIAARAQFGASADSVLSARFTAQIGPKEVDCHLERELNFLRERPGDSRVDSDPFFVTL